MIVVKVEPRFPMLDGQAIYTGWFLALSPPYGPALRAALEIAPEAMEATPRLMPIRVGDKGTFRVSPVDGRVLGLDLFGVRLTAIDILDAPTPGAPIQGGIAIPLHLPYDPVIFEQGAGEVESREVGFRHVGYRVAATRQADRFRVQFARGGPAERYVRIATCAVAGLSDESALVEVWLENVQRTREHS